MKDEFKGYAVVFNALDTSKENTIFIDSALSPLPTSTLDEKLAIDNDILDFTMTGAMGDTGKLLDDAYALRGFLISTFKTIVNESIDNENIMIVNLAGTGSLLGHNNYDIAESRIPVIIRHTHVKEEE